MERRLMKMIIRVICLDKYQCLLSKNFTLRGTFSKVCLFWEKLQWKSKYLQWKNGGKRSDGLPTEHPLIQKQYYNTDAKNEEHQPRSSLKVDTELT